MPGEMTNSILRSPFRPPPGTGSRPQLASILREGRKSANNLSSGVIWGIPGKYPLAAQNHPQLLRPG
jgi:hypothetical protein